MSVNYIFIARQGPVSPYGAHQVQAKMQITIQIRQQRRIIANNNEFESSYVHKALVYCSSYSTEVNLTFIKDHHIGGEHSLLFLVYLRSIKLLILRPDALHQYDDLL